jgi:PAS domain S-box-containing protein
MTLRTGSPPQQPCRRVSIAAALLIPFITICLPTILVLGVGFACAMSNVLSEALDEKSHSLTQNLTSELKGPLFLGETPHVKQMLTDACRSDADLAFAAVVTSNESIVASNYPVPKESGKDWSHLQAALGTTTIPIRLQESPKHFIEIIAPIDVADTRAGILLMEFSTQRVDARIRTTAALIAAVGCVALCLGIWTYITLIGKAIIQPVSKVVQIAAKVAEGDVGETIAVTRHDEIGELQVAMNTMISYLGEMANTANAIARGDLDARVAIRSPKDVFGNAFEKMIESLKNYTNELAAREQESKQLASIVHCSDDAIFGVTPDGEITSWNKGAAKLLGYSATEMIGNSMDMLLHSEHQLSLHGLINEVLSGHAVDSFETVYLRRQGIEVDVSLTISPVISETGEVVVISVIARDVTHKKAVEHRMREFYSVVSHEMRTPLTSIRGSLGLLSDGIVAAGSPEGKELIRLANASCLRLMRLINDILDLRKIEAGSLELFLQPASAEYLVSQSIDEMFGFACDRHVRLTSEFSVTSEVVADHDRAVQVLTNLISNAIKYSEPNGEVRICVNPDDSGKMLRFSICDQGQGIPVEMQSKLFQKFQQIDSSDSRSKEGTGLGLAISKAIVEQHGGRIGVQSEPGTGSTFWFEMPMLNSGIDADASNRS